MESLKPSVLQLVNNEEGRDLILFCLMKFSDEGNKVNDTHTISSF